MSDIKQKIPNWLTLFRVVIIPFLVLSFYLERGDLKFITTLLFVLASLSDFLDGYLSRKWNTTSQYGAMLDQISDKLIVTTALCLIITDENWLAIAAIATICREIFISGLREYLGKSGDISVPVTKLAKWKTASQMASIILLLLTSGNIANPGVTINMIYGLGCVLIWVSTGLTLYTGYNYYIAAKRQNLL